jgi:hypothetical protein
MQWYYQQCFLSDRVCLVHVSADFDIGVAPHIPCACVLSGRNRKAREVAFGLSVTVMMYTDVRYFTKHSPSHLTQVREHSLLDN